MSREARQNPRFALEAAVELSAGEVRARGRTDNVSRGGMCVIVDQPFHPGADIMVSLVLIFDAETASEPLELPARAVWSTPLDAGQHQLGIAFLMLAPEQKRYLDIFLRYLEGGAENQADEAPTEDQDPFAT